MNAILKAHSGAWLDSKVYRLAWLAGPLVLVMLVFGSKFWISPDNNLRVMQVPLSYTDEEREKIRAGLAAGDPAVLQALRAAAEDDDLRALNYMGLVYDPTSKPISKLQPNFDVALGYFDRAAALGSIHALMNAGVMLSSSGKPDQACSYFQRAVEAEPTRVDAMAEAGFCMATGKDPTAAEKTKGIQLMEAAAASGFVRAEGLLGTMYYYQKPPDTLQAIRHFEKAVAGNIVDRGDSHYRLGFIYHRGAQGVPQDWKKAIEHFQRAFEQGSAVSAVELSFVYARGNYGTPADAKKAMEYASFAAKEGQAVGHFNLYISYRDGFGTRRDYDLAAKHLINAISLGDRAALDSLKTSKSVSSEFVSTLQSKLAKAVIYTGPINGQVTPALMGSLESLLASKRLFE